MLYGAVVPTSRKSGETWGIPFSDKKDAPKNQRFWQARFYDFNVWTEKKRIDKLHYFHRRTTEADVHMSQTSTE